VFATRRDPPDCGTWPWAETNVREWPNQPAVTNGQRASKINKGCLQCRFDLRQDGGSQRQVSLGCVGSGPIDELGDQLPALLREAAQLSPRQSRLGITQLAA
jgi:hypothetical protein